MRWVERAALQGRDRVLERKDEGKMGKQRGGAGTYSLVVGEKAASRPMKGALPQTGRPNPKGPTPNLKPERAGISPGRLLFIEVMQIKVKISSMKV